MKKIILLLLVVSFVLISCGKQYNQGDSFEYKSKEGNNFTIKVESSNLAMWISKKDGTIIKRLDVTVSFKNEETKEIEINADNKFIEVDNQVIGIKGASNMDEKTSSNESLGDMLDRAKNLKVKPGLSKTIDFMYDLPANPNTDINIIWGLYKGKDGGFEYKVSLTPKVESYTN